MRVGVFVGSFNPVHIGHIKMTEAVFKKGLVDKILMIATLDYWDKKNLIPLSKRVAMLKLLATDNIIIDTEHNEYSYTCEILRDLKERSNDEYYLIIGADNLVNFHLWKNVEEILENKVIVVKRNNIDCDKYIKQFKNRDNFIVVDELGKDNISSTKIRESLKFRNKYLDERVLKYIVENHLYEVTEDNEH